MGRRRRLFRIVPARDAIPDEVGPTRCRARRRRRKMTEEEEEAVVMVRLLVWLRADGSGG